MFDINNQEAGKEDIKFDVQDGLCRVEIFDLLEKGYDLATSYVGEALYFNNGSDQVVAASILSLKDRLLCRTETEGAELSYLDRVDLLSALSHTHALLEFESSIELSVISDITEMLRSSLSN